MRPVQRFIDAAFKSESKANRFLKLASMVPIRSSELSGSEESVEQQGAQQACDEARLEFVKQNLQTINGKRGRDVVDDLAGLLLDQHG